MNPLGQLALAGCSHDTSTRWHDMGCHLLFASSSWATNVLVSTAHQKPNTHGVHLLCRALHWHGHSLLVLPGCHSPGTQGPARWGDLRCCGSRGEPDAGTQHIHPHGPAGRPLARRALQVSGRCGRRLWAGRGLHCPHPPASRECFPRLPAPCGPARCVVPPEPLHDQKMFTSDDC